MLTPPEFQKKSGVSRETLEKFQAYEALLRKWQVAINLVGPNTLDDIWGRHFMDSAQLFPLLPKDGKALVDMGAGAGFPGLVLAIMGILNVHLIESDQRKATFLREVARSVSVPVTVHAKRVEDVVVDQSVGIVTARALASLDALLDLGKKWLIYGATGFFLKGKTAIEEIEAAQKKHSFEYEIKESQTDPDARIVKVFHVKH